MASVQEGAKMEKVLYEKDGRIGRITLNRPDVMNAIDDDLPVALSAAVAEADADPEVHVMVLAGNGPAFCAGYDLTYYAEQQDNNKCAESSEVVLRASGVWPTRLDGHFGGMLTDSRRLSAVGSLPAPSLDRTHSGLRSTEVGLGPICPTGTAVASGSTGFTLRCVANTHPAHRLTRSSPPLPRRRAARRPDKSPTTIAYISNEGI